MKQTWRRAIALLASFLLFTTVFSGAVFAEGAPAVTTESASAAPSETPAEDASDEGTPSAAPSETPAEDAPNEGTASAAPSETPAEDASDEGTASAAPSEALAEDASIAEERPAPTSVSISVPNGWIESGDNMSVSVKVEPAEADQTLAWTSSNESVGSVHWYYLLFYALRAGTTTITATTVNGLSASVDVTVVDAALSAKAIEIGLKEKYALNLTGIDAVEWTSANETIARVSADGVVKGLKAGTTTVTASAHGLSFPCEVTVSKPRLREEKVVVTASKSTKLKVLFTTKSVKWSSSNKSVAVVNSKGKVTAKKPGKAIITATVAGYKLKCTVKVKANQHSFYVDKRYLGSNLEVTTRISKVYYKGSSLYVDIYVVNGTTVYTAYNIKRLEMYVYENEDSSLLVAHKRFKNIRINVKPRTMKKVTLKFTGSATKARKVDLRVNEPQIYINSTIQAR